MKRLEALTASADLSGEIPAGEAARLDRIRIALRSLRQEEARLRRLGLERPLVRCRETLRYWQFLEAVFAVPGNALATGTVPGLSRR